VVELLRDVLPKRVARAPGGLLIGWVIEWVLLYGQWLIGACVCVVGQWWWEMNMAQYKRNTNIKNNHTKTHRGEMPQPQRSSGSDHTRSHMGPSCGTSWKLLAVVVCGGFLGGG
jgi:hypothetical protein